MGPSVAPSGLTLDPLSAPFVAQGSLSVAQMGPSIAQSGFFSSAQVQNMIQQAIAQTAEQTAARITQILAGPNLGNGPPPPFVEVVKADPPIVKPLYQRTFKSEDRAKFDNYIDAAPIDVWRPKIWTNEGKIPYEARICLLHMVGPKGKGITDTFKGCLKRYGLVCPLQHDPDEWEEFTLDMVKDDTIEHCVQHKALLARNRGLNAFEVEVLIADTKLRKQKATGIAAKLGIKPWEKLPRQPRLTPAADGKDVGSQWLKATAQEDKISKARQKKILDEKGKMRKVADEFQRVIVEPSFRNSPEGTAAISAFGEINKICRDEKHEMHHYSMDIINDVKAWVTKHKEAMDKIRSACSKDLKVGQKPLVGGP
jgi:hypothetical protein